MKLSGTRKSIKGQRGITIIELLAYMILFTAFLAFAYRVVHVNASESRAIHNNASDIIRVTKAGERWRQDIREAVRSPQVTQSFLPNPQTAAEKIQITYLQIVKSSHTIWYAFREGSLYRGNDRQSDHWEVVLEENAASSTMTSELRGQTVVWRWELELKVTREAALTRPLFSFLAVPGKEQKP